jgi:hypothetical protein
MRATCRYLALVSPHLVLVHWRTVAVSRKMQGSMRIWTGAALGSSIGSGFIQLGELC